MKLTSEENQFIDSLYALSGVDKEDIEKVFEAFITHIIIKFYEKVEKLPAGAIIQGEIIEFTIPHFASMRVTVYDEPATPEEITKYKKESGGYIPRIKISAYASDFLFENIRQVAKGQTTEIENRIQLQIFESLHKKNTTK
jgi:hypothetical protein